MALLVGVGGVFPEPWNANNLTWWECLKGAASRALISRLATKQGTRARMASWQRSSGIPLTLGQCSSWTGVTTTWQTAQTCEPPMNGG